MLLKTNVIHPIAYHRHDFVWYPETEMNLVDRMGYLPYTRSIITEDPWLIALYDSSKVRVWDEDYGWVCPDSQTYGASVNGIMCRILNLRNTIPAQVLDGGDELRDFVDKTEKGYLGVPKYGR